MCHRQFGYGRWCRICVVEFLNSYRVYGWDVNYNVQDTPRSTQLQPLGPGVQEGNRLLVLLFTWYRNASVQIFHLHAAKVHSNDAELSN